MCSLCLINSNKLDMFPLWPFKNQWGCSCSKSLLCLYVFSLSDTYYWLASGCSQKGARKVTLRPLYQLIRVFTCSQILSRLILKLISKTYGNEMSYCDHCHSGLNVLSQLFGAESVSVCCTYFFLFFIFIFHYLSSRVWHPVQIE